MRLINPNIEIITVDYVEDTHPDYICDIRNLDSIVEKMGGIDICLCCQVLNTFLMKILV